MKKKIYYNPPKDKNYNSYDEMRLFLNKSRLLNEQIEFETAIEDVEQENGPEKEEKTKEYTVSGGKIIVHGMNEQELELTDEEKSTYQETMDEFVDQVSDMAEFHALNIYKKNVEWSGDILKFDVRFYYSISEVDGVYIGNANMVKIDDEFLELLTKLKTYYNVFETKWGKLLASRRKTEIETSEDLGTEI